VNCPGRYRPGRGRQVRCAGGQVRAGSIGRGRSVGVWRWRGVARTTREPATGTARAWRLQTPVAGSGLPLTPSTRSTQESGSSETAVPRVAASGPWRSGMGWQTTRSRALSVACRSTSEWSAHAAGSVRWSRTGQTGQLDAGLAKILVTGSDLGTRLRTAPGLLYSSPLVQQQRRERLARGPPASNQTDGSHRAATHTCAIRSRSGQPARVIGAGVGSQPVTERHAGRDQAGSRTTK
jgi:hypothetical protein